MTKIQKREAQLQKQIRKLERDYFVLQRENDSLKHEIKILTLQTRTMSEDLFTANRRVTEAEGKSQKIVNEVQKYLAR